MRKFWTEVENKIMFEKYPDEPTSVLVSLLGRSYSSINGQASVLGLRKSEAFRNSSLSGRISVTNDIGVATRFKNLQPGWNKGKKQSDYMSPEKIERTKATRFKKGQNPHNTVPIGTERLSKDGYVEVKIRHLKNGDANNKNFEFKHRVIYENHFGPIPDGMIVEFLDRDKFNFKPSNYVLKSRRENLLQNAMCDQSIVKRFLGVKDPKLVEMIIQEMPGTINQKRKTILLNQKIKKNAKSSE